MKKLLLITVLALFATNTISAQDSKGYVGVSIGAAIPQGDFADGTKTGLDLGIINAGYRFNETWGATLNWGATSHTIEDLSGGVVGVGYFAIGPMISFGDFDFKPQYSFSSVVVKSDLFDDITSDVESSWILGATYNFSLGGNWGLAANLDYLNFKIKDADNSGSVLKVSVGIQYRF
tara:strand:- start:1517 stop:2047 length:531 start_codon:yes stop_codon:yes gene_type:complete